MNSKERVNKTLRLQGAPDRVPLQFDLSRTLLETCSKKYDIPVQYTTSYFEDVTYRISGNELRVAMGSDCVVVGGSLPSGYSHKKTDDGCIINEFGMKMRQGLLYMDIIEAPLAKVSTVEEVLNFPFPDPFAEGRFDDAKKYIDKYKDDYFIIGDMELTMYEMSWHMVGMQKYLSDLAMGEAYCEALLDRVMEFSIGIGKKLLELGVDGLWLGDDFGAQNGMIISPKMWRRVFKPRYAEVFKEFRAASPTALMMYHCDGAVSPILEDLIEIGLQVFNPVQPNVPGHDPHELKSKFGSRLAFWGAIDQQYLLPRGSQEEIEKDVAEKIRILGENGGYMCAPAHIVQADTSLESLETFISAVKKFGVY